MEIKVKNYKRNYIPQLQISFAEPVGAVRIKKILAKMAIYYAQLPVSLKGKKIAGSLLAAMPKAAIEMVLFGKYLMAKHAPVRNPHLATQRCDKLRLNQMFYH